MIYYQLAESALEFIIAESASKYPEESGGILVGRFGEGYVSIEEATGPGPLARHSRRAFKRDGEYSQRALNGIVISSCGEYDYIGEWHSHSVRSRPSVKDLVAMRWIAANSRYAMLHPILGLCTKGSHDNWELSIYAFDGMRLRKLGRRQ